VGTDEEIEESRARALNAILEDASTHKVVAAGPGTGKTHTYRELLDRIDGPALPIAILTALVEDLAKDLGDRAQVRTFTASARVDTTTQPPSHCQGGGREFDSASPGKSRGSASLLDRSDVTGSC